MVIRRSAAAGLLSLFLFSGCISPGDTRLPVPYRFQEEFNYCVPACVLMWRLYDGLPAVSQTSIFNWMGGTGCTNQINTARAVNHFTNTRDAYWDSGDSSNYEEMVSRQVTAFDRGVPSIAVINYDHAVVLTGGKYHQENRYFIWDYVLVHDPNPHNGAHFRFTAGDWLREFCGSGQAYCDQIVSSQAVQGWYSNMVSNMDSIRVYGWDHDLGGPHEN